MIRRGGDRDRDRARQGREGQHRQHPEERKQGKQGKAEERRGAQAPPRFISGDLYPKLTHILD